MDKLQNQINTWWEKITTVPNIRCGSHGCYGVLELKHLNQLCRFIPEKCKKRFILAMSSERVEELKELDHCFYRLKHQTLREDKKPNYFHWGDIRVCTIDLPDGKDNEIFLLKEEEGRFEVVAFISHICQPLSTDTNIDQITREGNFIKKILGWCNKNDNSNRQS